MVAVVPFTLRVFYRNYIFSTFRQKEPARLLEGQHGRRLRHHLYAQRKLRPGRGLTYPRGRAFSSRLSSFHSPPPPPRSVTGAQETACCPRPRGLCLLPRLCSGTAPGELTDSQAGGSGNSGSGRWYFLPPGRAARLVLQMVTGGEATSCKRHGHLLSLCARSFVHTPSDPNWWAEPEAGSTVEETKGCLSLAALTASIDVCASPPPTHLAAHPPPWTPMGTRLDQGGPQGEGG